MAKGLRSSIVDIEQGANLAQSRSDDDINNSPSRRSQSSRDRRRLLHNAVAGPLRFLRHKRRKSKTDVPNHDEDDVVEGPQNENTPLMHGSDSSTALSYQNEERHAAGSDTDAFEPLNTPLASGHALVKYPQDSVSTFARSGWSKVRDHLAQGDFLLYGAFQGKQDEDPANLEKNHEEQVQEAIDEFRAGMQFSIVHCFVAIFIYFVVSIVCYNFFFEPDWSIVDSCYFAVTTFTTVGYGDITPTSDASMIFTCMYALTGVACLGIALGILGANLVDAQEKAVSKAEQESKEELLNAFSQSADAGIDSTPQLKRRSTLKHSKHSDTTTMGFLQNLVLRFAPLLILQVILASYIGYQAGWDLSKTFYYLIITACTVGYGDLAPTSQSGKLVAIIFIPLAVASMGQWLSMVANFIMEGRSVRHRRKIQRRELTQRDLDIMDADGDGRVTRAEFLEFMLVAMNKIDEDLVDELRRHFDRLDVDGTGELSHDDMVEGARRKLKTVKYKLNLAAYKERLLDQAAGNSDEHFWGNVMGKSGLLRALSVKEKGWSR